MVKIVIAVNGDDLFVGRDYDDLTYKDRGLIGQILTELEIIKLDLIDIYESEDE